MSPLDAKGGFHLHPGAAKMHDGAPPIAKRPDPGQQEQGESEKGHVELHEGPHPKAPDAKYHTIHHPSGEVKGHQTLHEAHHAMNEHMGKDGCTGDGQCEHGAEASGGDVSQGADDEY